MLCCCWRRCCSAPREPKLVPDVSQREIEIRYSFTGAELLLFGAILYPDGRAPDASAPTSRSWSRGRSQPIVVREKQKVAGIWINVESAALPLGARLSTRSPRRGRSSELVDERTAAIYELGLENLQLSPGTGASPEEQRAVRGRAGRPAAAPPALSSRIRTASRSPTACSTARASHIPARVPVGNYTAETFLIQRRPRGRRRGRARSGSRSSASSASSPTAAERWSLRLRPGRGRAVAAARLGGERLVPAPRLKRRTRRPDAIVYPRKAVVYTSRYGVARANRSSRSQ